MKLLFIISICFNAVLGNTTISFLEPETVEFVSYSDPISPREIRSSCQAYIEEYAKKAAQFTECSILNARPLRFCEKCITDFVTAGVLGLDMSSACYRLFPVRGEVSDGR